MYVVTRKTILCGTSCKPKLVDVEEIGRASKCLQRKLVSLNGPVISVDAIGCDGIPKSKSGGKVQLWSERTVMYCVM